MTTKFSLLFALAAVAQIALAVPTPDTPSVARPTGKRISVVPPINHSEYTVAAPSTVSALAASTAKPEDIAAKYVSDTLKIPAGEFRVIDVVPVSNGASAVHLRQVIGGIDVANAHINVNVGKNGQILSYGDSFFRGAKPIATASFAASKVTPQSGFEALAKAVNLSLAGKKVEVVAKVQTASVGTPKQYTIKTDAALSDVPVKQVYIQNGDKLSLTFQYSVELDHSWYNGHINADTGAVEKIVDWVSDAKYVGVPVGSTSPTDGGIVAVDGATVTDTTSSPLGWHDQGSGKTFTDTRGNNAYAQENLSGSTGNQWQTNKRPSGGASLDFSSFKPDLTKAPSTYTWASTAQLFLVVNQVHDITYKYGFDEKSGNFQENNFSKGGTAGDAIIANAQDGAGTDNADFATPPDGQRGKMRMYTFTETTPGRDGTYDTLVPIHEYGHGVSNRLTGGPANSNCLTTTLAGGMGEGWSDVLGLVLDAKTSDTRSTSRPAGAYVIGDPAGIRTYPYSTSTTVNPTLYNYLAKSSYQEVHMAGEVWATALFEVYWNLIDAYGFGAVKDGYKAGGKGNQLFLQLMLDGMKLQPCSPTFLQARDAIIQADVNLTGGKNKCAIWKGFAKRGLGVGAGTASQKYKNSSTLPTGC
ncbi:Fungalysin metallopeptidase-domain-containing protein [Blastocladiella britannica]|nr:Fungalysin metallopeptidase-domain-containing protein [Blastocladiella britannica]